MSVTLLELAAEFDREASRALRWQARHNLHQSAASLRRMVCNRAAADPAQHKLTLGMLIDITQRWCRQHGYRAVAGVGGLVLQRDDEETITVVVGDTLIWDGARITVRPSH